MSAIDQVRADIDAVEAAADALGAAMLYEQELEDGRAEVKDAAIRRIMGTENQQTGRPHSASSAKDVVETDPDYLAYRRLQSDAVVAVQRARGHFEAAKLRGRLAVALVEVGVTV